MKKPLIEHRIDAIIEELLFEQKKKQGRKKKKKKRSKSKRKKSKDGKVKRDRCLRIADNKFDKPSAYKSGAVVRCRDGKIWKDLKETIDVLLEDESLHKWFKRNKGTGWVDCNTGKKDPKTGKKKYKSCGRKKGEKRSKYPSCRPTPSKCKDKGKGKTWGKKSKKKVNESLSQIDIQEISDRVYPLIIQDLGGQTKPIEVHPNMWDRLGAVAVDDLKREQGNPDAQYDPYDNIIYLYSEKMLTEEDIIRSLLHEHTHTLQDQAEFKKLYDEGATYQNHPYEKEALRAEENWIKYASTKLTDILNEIDYDSIFRIEAYMLTDLSDRDQGDILSDMRALAGVTIVGSRDVKIDPSKEKSIISLKIDPYPFTKMDGIAASESIDYVKQEILKIPGVRSFKILKKS